MIEVMWLVLEAFRAVYPSARLTKDGLSVHVEFDPEDKFRPPARDFPIADNSSWPDEVREVSGALVVLKLEELRRGLLKMAEAPVTEPRKP
jgi:hypothetical protein